MADTKVTGLTENTTPATTDLMYIVDDPGGSPLSQKITLANLKTLFNDLATAAIFDALGDLVVGTGANTAAKLTVGANGTVLTADDGEATGLKWAAAGGSGDVATDAIWDAAGDIVQGTGANTAARLGIGTAYQALRVNAAANAVEWVGFSGCVLTKSAAQSVNTGTETAISFNGEVYDTHAYHDNSTNNTRLTAPATGYYMVGGSAEIDALNGDDFLIVRIRKEGSNADGDGRSRSSTGASAYDSNPFTRPVQLNSGQYVELTVEHNYGSARDIRTSALGTSFWIYRIG